MIFPSLASWLGWLGAPLASFSVCRPSLMTLSVPESLTFTSSQTAPLIASAAFFGLVRLASVFTGRLARALRSLCTCGRASRGLDTEGKRLAPKRYVERLLAQPISVSSPTLCLSSFAAQNTA